MSNNKVVEPIVLIPAAGESQRFKKIGITTSKPLLRFSLDGYQNKLMYQYCRSGLDVYREIYIGVRSSDLYDFMQKRYGVEKIIDVGESTKGQADTILQMIAKIDLSYDRPCLIINCDQAFKNNWLNSLILQSQMPDLSVSVLVFETLYTKEGDSPYSHVNQVPFFQISVEKRSISRWAIAGAFYFKSVRDLFRILENTITDNEMYLSEILDQFTGRKLSIIIPRDHLIEFGTPEQLCSLIGIEKFVQLKLENK